MLIKVRAVQDGELILEEVEATELKGFKDMALAHIGKAWYIFDIPTGLKIISATSKALALEIIEKRKMEVDFARQTSLYQKRIKEFEAMKKL